MSSMEDETDPSRKRKKPSKDEYEDDEEEENMHESFSFTKDIHHLHNIIHILDPIYRKLSINPNVINKNYKDFMHLSRMGAVEKITFSSLNELDEYMHYLVNILIDDIISALRSIKKIESYQSDIKTTLWIQQDYHDMKNRVLPLIYKKFEDIEVLKEAKRIVLHHANAQVNHNMGNNRQSKDMGDIIKGYEGGIIGKKKK